MSEEKEITLSATSYWGQSSSPDSWSLIPFFAAICCNPDVLLPHKCSPIKLQIVYLHVQPYKHLIRYLAPGNIVCKITTHGFFYSALKCFWVDFFFSFPPGASRSKRVSSKGCCARQIHTDIALTPLSCASKDGGNVQLRTDLWIYTKEREYSGGFFVVCFLLVGFFF